MKLITRGLTILFVLFGKWSFKKKVLMISIINLSGP